MAGGPAYAECPEGQATACASDRYTIAGRPAWDNENPEMTATKGDIDALNKRLNDIEKLLNCHAAGFAGHSLAVCFNEGHQK